VSLTQKDDNSVTETQAHIDVFLSCTQTKPSRRVFTWANFSTSNSKTLDISLSDPSFPSENELGTRVFYASIEAYSSLSGVSAPPLAYTISAEVIPRTARDIISSKASLSLSATIPYGTIVDSKARLFANPPALSSSTTLVLSSSSTSASEVEPITAVPPTPPKDLSSQSSSLCNNCQQLVPFLRLTMHESFCFRNNWRCDVCNAIVQVRNKASHIHCPECILICMSADDLKKHMEVLHASHRCENGCSARLVGPQSHEIHLQSECELRQVNCLYCNMPLSYKARYDHESKCGGRTTQCDICNKNVVRLKLEMHKASGCSKHSSTPSSSSSIRSSSLAASASLPPFALDGLGVGGVGPLGLAAHMLDSVFAAANSAAEAGGGGGSGGSGGGSGSVTFSPLPSARPSVRLISSVPLSSRSRDSGDDDIEYNYDDTYGDDDEEEENDERNNDDVEEATSAREAFDSAMVANQANEELSFSALRKERADAVSCPSCDRQIPSFDDLTIHLLSSCPNRSTPSHSTIVCNLLGEEAVNAISIPEEEIEGQVRMASSIERFSSMPFAISTSTAPVLNTASEAEKGVDQEVNTNSESISRPILDSLSASSSSSSSTSLLGADIIDQGKVSAITGTVIPSSILAAVPPPRRPRRMLQCPCCFMIFDSSVNEDDVQVHILTDCSSPWPDVERALKWIKPAQEGIGATNNLLSTAPFITKTSTQPQPRVSQPLSLVTESGVESTEGLSGSIPHALSDLSLPLPRHSSHVLSSSVRTRSPTSLSQVPLRPSLFSALVDDEEEDDDDNNNADNNVREVQTTAETTAVIEQRQISESTTVSHQAPIIPSRAQNDSYNAVHCPACGERMDSTEEDDLQLHMLTSCPNAEENARTLF
jgi:hypothetical protein